MVDKNRKDRKDREDRGQDAKGVIFDKPLLVYEPLFDVPENFCLGIADKKIGQRLKGIINYEVIEKTKSYTILSIKSFYLTPSARKF